MLDEVSFDRFRVLDTWVRPSNKGYDDTENVKEMIFFIIDEFCISQVNGGEPQLVTLTPTKSFFLINENEIAIQELMPNPEHFRLLNI
jgi:hypothetical protein